jgi:cephalosporin hydroxylase
VLSGETLATALYAIATGYRDRAKNLIFDSDELDEAERSKLMQIVWDDGASANEQAGRLGDALREMGADTALANECYRLAFYLSDEWAALAESNPLFAYFLAHRSGRLLDKWVHYFAIYHQHLAAFRERAPRVLEIGVYQGGSLEMWERYFGPSATLVGVDIDDTAALMAGPNRTVLIGDQSDPDFLHAVVQRHGPFDIVIDDGGHAMHEQIASVETLFPSLNVGGVYLVEDCHTSYWESFGGGRGRPGTFIEWVKSRVDDLHRYHQPEPTDPIWTDQVGAIHCYDSVVVLERSQRYAPFTEQVGGSEFLFRGRPSGIIVGEMLATRDAAIAQREAATKELSQLRSAVDEELRLARGELAQVRPRAAELERELERVAAELTVTRNDLLESWEQTRMLRQTLSWRLTAPLRSLRRRRGRR